MPTVNCYPGGAKPQFMLATGLPAVGYKLFMYVAGSVNTKQNTYTDSTGVSANTNPIVLNSLGEPTTEIWLTAGQAYKAVLAPSTDTDPPSSPVWTIDNLRGVNDTTVGADQWTASGFTPTFVSATQFTVPGDQTLTLQVGRRLKTTNTSGTIYSTITVSAYAALTTVTVVNDSGVLDSGLSAVSYGLLSKTNDSMPRGIFAEISSGSYASVFTMDGTGSPGSGSFTIKWQKTGNLVSLEIPNILLTTGTTTTTITSDNAMPVAIRGITSHAFPLTQIVNNGVVVAGMGQLLVIGASIIISRDPVATAFTNAAQAGLNRGTTISYYCV